MKFEAVLFDLDGTLLDTLADLADSMNAALAGFGLPSHPVETYKTLVGDGTANLARRALPADRRDEEMVARAVQAMRDQYSGRWDSRTGPYDGVPELLDALTARGIPMAVFSNKPQYFTEPCVAKLLGQWRFDVVVGATETVPLKPDPTGARRIAERLAIACGRFCYLGDTNTDMRTANAAGMYAVGAKWGFHTAEELAASGAKVLIDSPMELLDLL